MRIYEYETTNFMIIDIIPIIQINKHIQVTQATNSEIYVQHSECRLSDSLQFSNKLAVSINNDDLKNIKFECR